MAKKSSNPESELPLAWADHVGGMIYALGEISPDFQEKSEARRNQVLSDEQSNLNIKLGKIGRRAIYRLHPKTSSQRSEC